MFDNITPESIKESILQELPSWNTQSGSFANTIVSAAAYEIWQCYVAMNALVPMFYIDETSGAYIDKKCAEYGIERKAGAKAVVRLSFTGNNGTTIPARSVFMTAEGLSFLTDAHVTIAGGVASTAATAELEGTIYNVDAETIVSSKIVIGGLESVTNAQAAKGGIDTETDEALVERLYAYLRTPPTSGNVYHYMLWALEVTGVGDAKVLPLWDGPGTVKVLLAGSDGRAVDADIVAAAEEHIEDERPIGAEVTVESAVELAISASASITIDGSTTKSAVQTAFAAAVANYLQELVFFSYTVNYNRIAYLLLSIPGVIDYSSLTVNGGTGNVSVGDNQIPVPGTVEVS